MGKAVKRQVPWTKTLLEEFVNEAMLSEDEWNKLKATKATINVIE